MNLAATCTNMAVPCEYVRRMNMTPEERALADANERDLLDKALIRGSASTEGKAEDRVGTSRVSDDAQPCRAHQAGLE